MLASPALRSAKSIAVSTSSGRSTSAAAALAWTCSGREAPVMAEATSVRRSTYAKARAGRLRPASCASGTSRCTSSSVASLSTRSREPFIVSLAKRLSVGSGCPGRYLPVSTPWASGDHTMLEMAWGGAQPEDLGLG